MKTVFLINSLRGGGAERVSVTLANQLVSVGEDVAFFLFDVQEQAYKLDNRIRVYSSGNYGKYRLINFLKRLFVLRKYVRQEKPDILMAFMIGNIPYGVAATIGTRTKVIGLERANPKMHSKKIQFIIQWIAPLCDGFIFQTEGARQYYPAKMKDKSIVIGNPISVNIQRIPIKRKNEFKMCSVGRLHRDKDFETLLKAFAIFSKKYQSSHLDIIGDGDNKNNLIQLTEKLGVEAKVNFLGFVKNIHERLCEYDLFVFQSKAEGTPNALLEAMAVGLPCISADCDYGPREIIKSGKNGLLVPVGDAQKMAEAMEWMIEHEIERERLGEQAKAVREKFSVQEIGYSYLNYMRTCI